MRRALSIVLLTLLALGCASYPTNPKLSEVDTGRGYRFNELEMGEFNSDEVFIVLTLSGGGTRAAALSYGAMQHLDSIALPGGGSLLDEVDVISSVSGGSFAAAYYGLFGKDRFFASFEKDVLHRDIERALILRLLNPINWWRIASPSYSRSDVADRYYADAIFDDKRFEDMSPQRPFIMLNATDISMGVPFSFVQEHFDRLCSDLGGVHVSRGVVSSSAFPVAFPPLTIDNYRDGECDYEAPMWVDNAYRNDMVHAPRRYNRAKAWRSYSDPKRRYLHLSDGGLSDNIGLRRPAWSLMTNDSPWSVFNKLNNAPESIKHLVVIVVDAKPEGQPKLDRKPSAPGIATVIENAATDPMENFSAETVQLLGDHLDGLAPELGRWERRRDRCHEFAEPSKLDQCLEESFATDADRPRTPTAMRLIHLRFDAIRDEKAKRRLKRIPTRLQLPKKDVDRLIDAAGELLDQSEAFQELVSDLQS